MAKCANCGMFLGAGGASSPVIFKGVEYCSSCAVKIEEKALDEEIGKIIITSTHNLDGYKITKYICIESVEIVIGTGIFSEFEGSIADFLGKRSNAFENKLANAKQAAFTILKKRALEKGGNAIVGVDMDFTEFSGNRIGFILNGTVVETRLIDF